jgi:hypothetical protein
MRAEFVTTANEICRDAESQTRHQENKLERRSGGSVRAAVAVFGEQNALAQIERLPRPQSIRGELDALFALADRPAALANTVGHQLGTGSQSNQVRSQRLREVTEPINRAATEAGQAFADYGLAPCARVLGWI